jgi:hypothetical protein
MRDKNNWWESYVESHEWGCNDSAISGLKEAVDRLTLGDDECADEENPGDTASLALLCPYGSLSGRCCCLGSHPTARRVSCKQNRLSIRDQSVD